MDAVKRSVPIAWHLNIINVMTEKTKMTDIEVTVVTEIIPDNYTVPEIGLTICCKKKDKYKADMLIHFLEGLEGWDILCER